jgi:hypothetical protein
MAINTRTGKYICVSGIVVSSRHCDYPSRRLLSSDGHRYIYFHADVSCLSTEAEFNRGAASNTQALAVMRTLICRV